MKHYIQPTLTVGEYLYLAVLVRLDIARRLGMDAVIPVLEQFDLSVADIQQLCEKFAVGVGTFADAHERGEDIGV